jgi:hypothetical protein
VVTEIETVDGEYCFSLRAGGQDFVLFGFSTKAEADVARTALRQIVQHASVVLPIAPDAPAVADAPKPADDSDTIELETKLEATSPFSK